MKRFIYFFLIILISCSSPKIMKVDKIERKENIKSADAANELENIKKEIPVNELAYLFFNKAYFQKNETSAVKKDTAAVNENDYKAVVEWRYKDTRRIKLKNIKTGKEYVITESDRSGEIILVERNLFYYKFKIGNTIIKVKR
jgi:hypothetical protein